MGKTKWAVVVAAVCLVVAIAAVAYAAGKAAVPVQEVVRARRFEVVDGRGRERATFGALPSGDVGVALMGESGETRAGLRVQTNGSTALSVWDEDGKVRLGLGIVADSPSLVLFDKAGKTGAILDIAGDGSPRLVLRDGKGGVRSTLAATPDGRTGLVLCDEGGNESALLSVGADGASLSFHGREGKVLWSAP